MASHTRWSIHVGTKRLIAVAAAVLVVGCSMEKQTAPSLTGPSELGLSIGVTATPDVITQDGQSQATIGITARDASNQPWSGVTLRVETYLGGTPVDIGTLSTKVVSTGADGRATLTYRAPAAPPPSVTSDTTVSIAVTPVGNDYAGFYTRTADVRLARPGVITPPDSGLTPQFTISPSAPNIGDSVSFDASASTTTARNITSYSWQFGDGSTATGKQTQHIYVEPGALVATLTVTDDLGRTAQTSKVVQVAAPLPTAKIVFSPTDPVPGDIVFFTADASTTTAGRAIVYYEWNFGDGTVVGGPDKFAQHTYVSERTYSVTLKVRDSLGRENVVSTTVQVRKKS